MIERILIDIDDVLADCTVSALRHMGLHDWEREDYTLYTRDIQEQYRIVTGIDYTSKQFWSHFNRKWWASIPPTPWCHDLIDLCIDYVDVDNIALLTAPINCADCLSGKLDWIKEYMPEFLHCQYIMTQSKQFCASPGTVLIDDHGPNILQFAAQGGMGIALPQRWNCGSAHIGKELRYVRDRLDNFNS